MGGKKYPGATSPTQAPAPLSPTPAEGLSSDEAQRRLGVFGPNEVPTEQPRTLHRIAAQLWGPVPWMLEVAFVLELVIGGYPSAAILAGLIVFNGLLSVSQEQRARAALDMLRERLQVLARVQRGGTWRTLPARDLVPGDRLHIRMGDIVPADALLVEGSVEVDQSMLTGESTAVSRGPAQPVFSGSVIRRGEATGEVTATSVRTYFGRTAELVRSAHARSHLQDLMFKVVSYLIVADAVLALLVVGDGLVQATNLFFLVPFLLIILIASVPVALPATFTVASAIESRRLAEKGVLVTGLSGVEDAAGMDLLFADKTGTLTQNRQTVTDLRPFTDLTSDQVLSLAAVACDESTQDPIDIAILDATRRRRIPRPDRTQFVPFDPAAKRSEAWIREGGEAIRVVLGAPAVIGAIASMPAELAALQDEWGSQGYRILAVGKGPAGALRTVGAVALADPIREEAPELIRTLHELGIRVVMVTGDGITTARAVGRSLGLDGPVGSREGPLPSFGRVRGIRRNVPRGQVHARARPPGPPTDRGDDRGRGQRRPGATASRGRGGGFERDGCGESLGEARAHSPGPRRDRQRGGRRAARVPTHAHVDAQQDIEKHPARNATLRRFPHYGSAPHDPIPRPAHDLRR